MTRRRGVVKKELIDEILKLHGYNRNNLCESDENPDAFKKELQRKLDKYGDCDLENGVGFSSLLERLVAAFQKLGITTSAEELFTELCPASELKEVRQLYLSLRDQDAVHCRDSMRDFLEELRKQNPGKDDITQILNDAPEDILVSVLEALFAESPELPKACPTSALQPYAGLWYAIWKPVYQDDPPVAERFLIFPYYGYSVALSKGAQYHWAALLALDSDHYFVGYWRAIAMNATGRAMLAIHNKGNTMQGCLLGKSIGEAPSVGHFSLGRTLEMATQSFQKIITDNSKWEGLERSA